jgi:Arc/MetJ-type ribon-helix-helix transcriptional regulator
MSNDISQENENFIQQVIEEGSYRDRTEVLDEAVELLKGRRELLDHIDIGTQQLRNGECLARQIAATKGIEPRMGTDGHG